MKYWILLVCVTIGSAQEQSSPANPVTAAPVKPTQASPADAVKARPPSAPPAASSAKTAKTESLKYRLSWPSGLDLGDAILSSAVTEKLLNFGFQMDVSVAGFSISESVESRSTPEYCATLLYKRGTRGQRKVDERTEFDTAKMTAVRRTEGGGKSEFSTNACAKDALTYIFFLRRELAGGRLPAQQKVYYGGAYDVSVKFVGTERIPAGEEAVEAEKITATVKGPASNITADLFFAKDATRTPLLVRVPLKVGEFKLELIR